MPFQFFGTANNVFLVEIILPEALFLKSIAHLYITWQINPLFSCFLPMKVGEKFIWGDTSGLTLQKVSVALFNTKWSEFSPYSPKTKNLNSLEVKVLKSLLF